MVEPASLVLTLSEGIPLSCTLPGARAIVVNCVGCPGCDLAECPWGASVDPRISKRVELHDLIKVLKRGYSIELVFFRCINDTPSETLLSMLNEARSMKRFFVGFSVHVAYIDRVLDLLKNVDIVQVVVTPRYIEALNDIYSRLRNYVLSVMEIAIVVEPKTLEYIHRFLGSMKNNTIDVPATVIPTEDIDPRRYSSLIDAVRKLIPLTSDPLSPMTDIASVICPRCRGYVILRVSGSILKLNVDEHGRCKYCGNKVVTLVTKCVHRYFIDIPLA